MSHHSGTSSDTGGLSGLYDLLVAAGEETPVDGNQNGSYLTMKSNQGLVFGAATILSGFAGVFCDQGYWQRVSLSDTQNCCIYPNASAGNRKSPLLNN